MQRDDLRQLLLRAVDAGLDTLADGLAAAAPPAGPVFMAPIADLKVAPELYQFRVSPLLSTAGTDARLKGCRRFRRELAGVVLAWREPSGQLAIIDGHHRLQLARRDGVLDLAVLEVQATGPREARRVGALANLAAGHATPADVARLLRDEAMTPAEVAEFGVSARSKLLADAAALVPLAPDLFGLVCTGEMELPMALALASIGSTVTQRELHREATRRGWSAEQVAEAASLAQLARTSSTEAVGCLPGLEAMLASESSDLGALLSIRAEIRRQLSTELRALRAVAHRRSAAALEAAEVAVIDVAGAAEARDATRATARLFGQLAHLSGPLQTLIRALADEVAAGRPAADVVAQRLPEVRAALERELGG